MSEKRATGYITVFDGTNPHHVPVHRADVTRVVFRMDRHNRFAVTAPLHTSDEQLVAFVSKHIAAFVKKQKTRTKNVKLDIPRRIVALDGNPYALKPVKAPTARSERLEFVNDACYAHVFALTEARIEAVVKKGYLQLAGQRLPRIVDK